MELLDEQRHQSRKCTIVVRRQVFVLHSAILTFDAIVRRRERGTGLIDMLAPIAGSQS